MFECVILAGGFGTRLKSVSGDIPKPMVAVGDEPFLYKLMRKLEADGCSKIILSLYYRSDYIISRINADRPVQCKVQFCVENSPLGTGGALKLAAEYVSQEKFIVLNGDTYQDIDYSDFFDKSVGSDLFISASRVSDCQRYGVLNLDNDLNVMSMSSGGFCGSGYINSGTYVVNTKDVVSFTKEAFSFEADFIQHFDGIFKAYVTNGEFIDIGVPEDYYRACARFS